MFRLVTSSANGALGNVAFRNADAVLNVSELCCFFAMFNESNISSVLCKSRVLLSPSAYRLVTSYDDCALGNVACGNAYAEVNSLKWC